MADEISETLGARSEREEWQKSVDGRFVLLLVAFCVRMRVR